VQPQPQEVVVELLDSGLMPDGRIREVTAARPVGHVLSGCSVDVVEALGFRVPGLELLI
jgi:hypothetical protein